MRYTPRRIVAGAARRVRVRAAEEVAVVKALLAGDADKPELFKLFGHADDQTWFSLNTEAYRRRATLQRLLPALPESELQAGFVGSSGDVALREGWMFYKTVRELAARWSRPIGPSSNVLDFGCGWGRILRFFLRDVPGDQLWGADVLSLSVDVCRKTNPYCHFTQVSPFPPTDLPSEKFDVVYLYSVFSHLSEDAHQRWLTEFHRVLRPGGLVIATTWHRTYFEACARARHGVIPGTHSLSGQAFQGDTAEWSARYDRGEYCHSPIGAGGDHLSSDYYGETCIPEGYVRARWTDRFIVREFLPADARTRPQTIIAAQKR